MKKKYVVLMFVSLAISVLLFSGCIAGKYKPVTDMGTLIVVFADTKWDGVKIPAGQQCNKFGGKGKTPELLIKNIPQKTNALIFEYSDRSHQPMDNGGHGKIGYRIKPGSSKVKVPSVAGHTFELPEGFFLITAHQSPGWDKAGAYMPPCSGGRGNLYYLDVKAVYDAPEGEGSQLLSKGRLTLGRY